MNPVFLQHFARSLFLVVCVFTTGTEVIVSVATAQKPNIVLINCDDLGYGELGCYGQKLIRTPRLDDLAKRGMRFTQFYAGNTVCAPSRSVLMTGLHVGHTFVRGNAGGTDMARQTLRTEDITVAEVLKQSGYRTGLFGKWGLGEINSSGHPLRKGFDRFYGYLNQVHAHNFYPEFLWDDYEKAALANQVERMDRKYGNFLGGSATVRNEFAQDKIMANALDFVRESAAAKVPFFLYLAPTLPHANNEGTRQTGNGAEVPDYDLYKDQDWSLQNKCHAAMVSYLDRDVGRLIDLLGELSLDQNTLVVFTSDNGPHDESGHDPKLFAANGPLRGIKRALYDGGIRVPMIAYWPGKIAPATTSEHVGYAGDFFATFAELSGSNTPSDLDSISFAPSLFGERNQQQHEYLYWEFYEQGSRQAVRFGNWKAIRQPMFSGPIQLFDLTSDIGEQSDVAADNPDVVQTARDYLNDAHVENSNWQVRSPKRK